MHQRRGGLHVVGQRLDRLHRLDHPRLARQCRGTGLVGGVRRGYGVTRNFLDCRGHFVDRCGGLVDLRILLVQPAVAVFGDRVEFGGGRCQLSGRTADVAHGFTQIDLHHRQGTQQSGDFVFAIDFDGMGQVAVGNLLGGGYCTLQRADDAAGQPECQADGAQRGNDHKDNDDVARLVVLGPGRLAFRIDLSEIEVGQVTELLAGTVDDLLHVDQQQLVQPDAVALAGQCKGTVQRTAVLAHGHHELVGQRLLFRGVDKGLEDRQLLVQIAQTHIHLTTVGRNTRRIGVQCHAQGNGPNTQHDFADIVDHSHAGQPVGLHRHFALADGRHLRQRKPPQQCHQQGNKGKTQTGTTSDSEFA